jgi:polar amino acid transport system substrate-binding protein
MSLPGRLLALLAVLAALVLGACGGDDEAGPSSGGTATPAAKDAADACAKDQLALQQPGKLVVGTDKPAFPPYFEDDDPANGKGFESAVAYAVAEELGFSKDDVEWTVVPFNSSYAPGPKDFDFDVNQISITPQRAKRVDFSEPYYTAPQAVVAPKGSAAAGATSLADLAGDRIGVQIGTTSLEAVAASIKPTQQPKVFNDSNDVVTALKQKQVDAVVIDLPTAFYLTAAQVPSAKIVGQFEAPGGDAWGALLQKGSKLTPCVSQAIKTLESDGRLAQIEQQWMGEAAGAPELR